MDEKFVKDLKKKNRQTLLREQRDLQDRQAELRNRKEMLQDRREELRDNLYATMKAKDKDSEDLILKQLEEIRNDISEINSEYKTNSEALECYSKISKNKEEGKSSLVATLFTGVGTGAAIWLGKKSLENAYKSDTDGTLVNKKSLDVFNRLNPLKMIQHFRR